MEFKQSKRLAMLPLLLSLALGSFVAVPRIHDSRILVETFLVTAGLLATWSLGLMAWMSEKGRTPEFAVSLLKQHYLQACAHASILVYWGWYFREVYHQAFLILAQLVFAYAFDMLLQLTRKGKYTLGFGPFPVIFSTNLFLWFLGDWFYFQFLLIAVGFAAKDLIHWTRNGKSVHIFNPSSFPLAITSWILLFSKHFDITLGDSIAGTQFFPPHIFPFIFLVSLPGQFFFGVTTMTLAAVVTMYAWAAAYLHFTGIPFGYQDYIPIAVFLAMNLLFTDPSTSPRSELGRMLFGVAYGATVVVLELLVRPAFPSKLLLVPVLNLAVPLFERVGQSRWLQAINPARIAPHLVGRRRNLAYMTIWASVFAALISLRGIGDDFRGQEVPFWKQACKERGERACAKLDHVEGLGCAERSAWSCNEFAIAKHAEHDNREARQSFAAACQLGSQVSCENMKRLMRGSELEHFAPTSADYPILLSVFKNGRRKTLQELPEPEILAKACGQGWAEACGQLGEHGAALGSL